MENQHRKITGYRELNQDEINLMNEIKALGPVIEPVLEKVRLYLINQVDEATRRSQPAYDGPEDKKQKAYDLLDRHGEATPQRFVAIAKTDFQTALMALTRAVAQPTFF
jgi:hypothetical protein